MLETREEAVSNFLHSCKAIQPYTEYIEIEIYNNEGFSINFGLHNIDEVRKVLNDYPKCSFKVSNVICLDTVFKDELSI